MSYTPRTIPSCTRSPRPAASHCRCSPRPTDSRGLGGGYPVRGDRRVPCRCPRPLRRPYRPPRDHGACRPRLRRPRVRPSRARPRLGRYPHPLPLGLRLRRNRHLLMLEVPLAIEATPSALRVCSATSRTARPGPGGGPQCSTPHRKGPAGLGTYAVARATGRPLTIH